MNDARRLSLALVLCLAGCASSSGSSVPAPDSSKGGSGGTVGAGGAGAAGSGGVGTGGVGTGGTGTAGTAAGGTGGMAGGAAGAMASDAGTDDAFGQTTAESRANGGTVTLTTYAAGASVDGTVDVTFPVGSAKGSFHAAFCATGNEL